MTWCTWDGCHGTLNQNKPFGKSVTVVQRCHTLRQSSMGNLSLMHTHTHAYNIYILVIFLSDDLAAREDKNAGENGKYFLASLACKTLKAGNIYTRHIQLNVYLSESHCLPSIRNVKGNSLAQQKFVKWTVMDATANGAPWECGNVNATLHLSWHRIHHLFISMPAIRGEPHHLFWSARKGPFHFCDPNNRWFDQNLSVTLCGISVL